MKKTLKRLKEKYWGNLSGVEGNLDECELTTEDRNNGININDLIKE